MMVAFYRESLKSLGKVFFFAFKQDEKQDSFQHAIFVLKFG